MKIFFLGFLALFTTQLKGQNMNTPEQSVVKLFVSTDQQDWLSVEACLADKVLLDYSSMNGSPASELTPEQISSAWKSILPGFESTHHQLGNFIVDVSLNQAKVFCYGTATHFLNNSNGNLWTVVGTYNFELQSNTKGEWQITSMKFNFKYQDGNTSLPEQAMNNLK